ncbi:outer membrane biogenesis protein BamB [Anatilimnocola aggregata]|uniref:Outer membrane biogenesis protein BamB n=1 Tax=Anatilimnocola aggregata TaxID=2528021 RepID=A0A517YC18_9BACT|nr:PQQ-binding-like beta-propeller repeat protein [Anatilimnocola aggregata]QDU27785.1 outer membrane biogenesis protein BamB [Anatilimnocola aggregata]
MRLRMLAAGLAVLGWQGFAQAENWPQFRGPTGAGLVSEEKLTTEWGNEKNIAWKVEVPGAAWSQPVVWGDKIFVTTAVTENQTKPKSGGGGFGGGGFGGGFGGRPGSGRPGGSGSDAGDTKKGETPKAGDGGSDNSRDDEPRQPPRGSGFGGRPGSPGSGRPGGFGGGFGGGGFGGRGSSPPNAVYRWKVLCLDRATGKVLWENLAKEGKPTISIHSTNTYASETPVTDGERLYAYFGMTGLFCYDLDGKLLWKKDVDSYPMMNGWGAGSSPALDGNRLFIQCDNEEKSFLVAFDKKSGDELWRVSRNEKSNWSTPFVWKNKERTELVTGGGTKMRSYDPATGKLLWELGGSVSRCSATPVGDAELLYVGSGGGMGGNGPLCAVKAGASGDVTPGDDGTGPGVEWTVERAGPPMASPLLYRGNLYVLDQRGGVLSCFDAKTGKQHFKQRLPSAKGFTSSPWAGDGKVFCLDESGQTFVLEAGNELKVLATNKLDDMFWSSAAIAGDQLLLRGIDRLYCIKQ